MPRSYRPYTRIRKRDIGVKKARKNKREICEKYDFSMKQLTNFITRYNTKQKKPEAEIAIKCKGRPPRDDVVSEQDKVAELKYIFARKQAKIKSLEMEDELMQDFLSLTERKREQA